VLVRQRQDGTELGVVRVSPIGWCRDEHCVTHPRSDGPCGQLSNRAYPNNPFFLATPLTFVLHSGHGKLPETC
jgi:hypothetical protein